MNKEYLIWIRQLQKESAYIRFGQSSLVGMRRLFIAGQTPFDAAFTLIPW